MSTLDHSPASRPAATASPGSVTVVRPAGRLDLHSAPALEAETTELLDRRARSGEPARIVIDLAGVETITSFGLAVCLRAAKRAQTEGCPLVFAAPRGAVLRAFELSNFTRMLHVAETVEDATRLAAFADADVALGEMPRPTDLSLVEEMMLLVIDPESGAMIELPDRALEFALAGAALMELSLRRRIDNDGMLYADAPDAPVGDGAPGRDDPVLEPIRAEIEASEVIARPTWWLDRLQADADRIRRGTLDSLVERGILERRDGIVGRLFGRARYLTLDDSERCEIRGRLLRILRTNELPTPHDVSLVALCEACAVFDAIVDPDELVALRPRILGIARMEPLACALTTTLEAAQHADVLARAELDEALAGP